MVVSKVGAFLQLATQLKQSGFLFYFVHLEKPDHLVLDLLLVLDEVVELFLSFGVNLFLLIVVILYLLKHFISLILFFLYVE